MSHVLQFPELSELGGVARAKPAKQGDLEGSCGFYAIFNAVCLCRPNLLSEDSFRSIIFSHPDAGKRKLPAALLDGMHRYELNHTLREFITEDVLLDELPVSRPFWSKRVSLPRWWSTVQRHLREPNRAAIIGIWMRTKKGEDGNPHWTVIRRMTSDHIFLFDSGDELGWARSECEVVASSGENVVPRRAVSIEGACTFLLG